MAGKTPREAAWSFIEPIQRSLSCVTPDVLNYGGGDYPREVPHVLYVGSGDPVHLPGGARISLTFRMHYRLVRAEGERGPWKVQIAGYLYGIDDVDGREILAYHWHPEGRSSEREPHLHLGAGAYVGRAELTAAHLPTGRISVEELLVLAIRGLGVEPRRDDWEAVLAENQSAFEIWRTWQGAGRPPRR